MNEIIESRKNEVKGKTSTFDITLSKNETSGGNYYKVKNILAYDNLFNFNKFLVTGILAVI